MTQAGWIIMSLAVGGMTFLAGWCTLKVIFTPSASEHLHSQADEPPDVHDEDE